MAKIHSLAYVGFGVSDVDSWQWFAADILGLQIGRRDAQGLSLRMDECRQRIFLQRSSTDDLLVAGWLLQTEGALEEYVAQLRATGVEVEPVSPETLRHRMVEKAYSCRDPNGFTHEFCYGQAVAERGDGFRSKVLQSDFVTGDLGFGHILVSARNGSETVRFYEDVVQLRISDYIREEVEPGRVLDAAFFHAATGRHHSIATAQVPGPKALNHFMVQVEHMDDVGFACDRVRKAGIPVVMELGRHPNDRMFSFYAQTPSGFNVEVGWGGIVIDDASWQVRTYSRISDWGHHRPSV